MRHARFVLALLCAAAVAAPARPAAAADEKKVAKLLKQLKDRKEDKRIEASYELVDMKVEAAVPALIEALHDTSREVRYNAAGALWNLGEAARPAVPELMKRLSDDDPGVRVQAAGALNNLDTAAAEWVAAARSALRDGDEETRKSARDLLKRAGNGGIQSAAHDGQVEVVTGLLDGGIEVDALDKHKRTALHWAAQADKPAVAKLLLAKGASVALADEDGNQPLHVAANAGSVEVTRLILAKKPDLNVANRHRFTPLHLAAGQGAKPVVELLLAAGANPRAKADGAAPIHLAALKGKTDVVLLFLSKGVDINIGDEHTAGPIYYAAAGGHTELVKLLLDRKAAVKASDLMHEVRGLHRGLAVQEQLDQLRVPARRRVVDGTCGVLVPDVDVDAFGQEEQHDVRLALERGQVDGRGAVGLRAGIRSRGQEQLDDRLRALAGGKVQRREPVTVRDIEVGLLGQDQARHFHGPGVGGHVQGLIAVFVREGHAGALGQEQLRDRGLVGLGRPVQGRALVLVERVHLDAAVEQAGDDLDLAVVGRGLDASVARALEQVARTLARLLVAVAQGGACRRHPFRGRGVEVVERARRLHAHARIIVAQPFHQLGDRGPRRLAEVPERARGVVADLARGVVQGLDERGHRCLHLHVHELVGGLDALVLLPVLELLEQLRDLLLVRGRGGPRGRGHGGCAKEGQHESRVSHLSSQGADDATLARRPSRAVRPSAPSRGRRPGSGPPSCARRGLRGARTRARRRRPG